MVDGGKGNDYIVDSYVEVDFREGEIDEEPETDIEKWTSFDNVSGWAARRNENTIKGGAGDDTIKIYGAYTTVEGGKGNDSISLKNTSTKTLLKYASGDGDDTVVGLSFNDTLHITNDNFETLASGDDLILNVGTGSVLLKDALADGYTKINLKDSSENGVIYNDWKVRNGSVENNLYSNVTLAGSQKADTIENSAENVLITVRGGNDSISNKGANATIDGGKGNDKISLSPYSNYNVIQYAAGDGNDTIYGFNSDDFLYIANGSYTTTKSGKNIKVKVGEGSIILKDFSGAINFYDGQKIFNGSVENNLYSNVTLAGSDENDTITNDNLNVLITGKAGDDSISNSGENVTIDGGKGKDYISLYSSKNLIQYASGDGNDTIFGFNADDTLQITSGTYSTKTKGKDIIVTVGKGTIRLKDAKGKDINIVTAETTAQTAELFAEDNFVTADNISEIVAEKSVGEIEFAKPEKISQENLITYAK